MTTTPLDVLKDGLSDFRLAVIEWLGEGKDVIMVFVRPSTSTEIRLRFTWVYDLRASLDYGEYTGAPLVHKASFGQLQDGSFEVHIEFDPCPTGRIEFKCIKMEEITAH